VKDLIALHKTILLVDDEKEILEFVKDQIEPFFGQILIANNGIEACEILKEHHVDLLVTDYMMPSMNGIQLMELMKKNYPTIPIIMLTGNANNPEIIQAINEGAFDVIEKPHRKHILVNRIQNGLFGADLVKTLWSIFGQNLEFPRLEEFMRKPVTEQHKILHAFSAISRMKAVAQRNKESA
jgi:CheY-like chemotaxis protein